jgi:hypothetical protein
MPAAFRRERGGLLFVRRLCRRRRMLGEVRHVIGHRPVKRRPRFAPPTVGLQVWHLRNKIGVTEYAQYRGHQ